MIRKSGNARSQPLLWRRCRSLRSLKQIHATMIIKGFLNDSSKLRELIFTAAISVPSATHYAHKVFDKITKPDVFMYNTVIRGTAHTATPWKAIEFFARMEGNGIRPNELTFPFLFRACTKMLAHVLGLQIHAKVVKFGLGLDVFVRNSMINMYASCGDLGDAGRLFDGDARMDAVAWSSMIAGYARRGELGVARELFDESPSKDLVSWNVMITAYVKQGDMERARELFEQVPEKDVVSWNSMIAGYVKWGSFKQAMEVFERMCTVGEKPDEVSMLSLVSACADSGALDTGKKIHSMVLDMSRGRELPTVLGNALIDMYGKCGSIDGALAVFRGMRQRDLSTWNSVIGGLACNGHSEESIQLFKSMLEQKMHPDEITFVSVLVACNHGGMVDEGRRYYTLMQSEYGLKPNLKHYGCMVDMLGRAGLLKDAFEFVDQMKIKPNPVIWRALLGSCKTHGDVRLAERANEQLLKMKNDSSGDYVLLSNLYASRGEWVGAEKVRKLMDDRGVHKEAGGALIGVDDKVFTQFLVRPQFSSIRKEAVFSM